jgi:Zn-dependent protease
MNFFIGIPVLLFSVTIHEVSHGFIAEKRGDPTAKIAGRLTLNPIAHLDLFGSIIFPLLLVIARSPFVFGWAKPVPVNFYNLINPKKDMILVAIAGPVSNFLLGFICAIFLRILNMSLFLPLFILQLLVKIFVYGIIINTILGVFNLIPIPPLDGSRIVMGLLPYPYSSSFSRLEPYGIFIFLFLFALGIINVIMNIPVNIMLKFFEFISGGAPLKAIL